MPFAGTDSRETSPAESARARTSLLLFTNQRLVGGLRGGMERHMELVAQHVDRKRFRVFGMVPDLESMTDFATTFGRHVDELVRITVDREHPANYVPFARQVRRWGIDVLHVQNAHYLGQNLLIATAKLAGVKKVFVTDHQAPHAPESSRARFGRVVMASMVDGLIAVSDYNLSARRKFIHTPADKAVVV